MPERPASAADQEVLDAATSGGTSLTARQLERWRQLGVIPRPRRRWLGRGLGSSSSYDADEVQYIVEFARRSGRKRRPSLVTAWMYLSGVDVPEDRLRMALSSEIDFYRSAINRHTAGGDVLDSVDLITLALLKARGPESRIRRRRLRSTYNVLRRERNLEPISDLFRGEQHLPTFSEFEERFVLAMVGAALAGESPDMTALNELATDLLLNLKIDGKPPRPDEEFLLGFRETLRHFTFDNMALVATNATYAALLKGRDHAFTAPAFESNFSVDLSRPPEPMAVMLPLFMLFMLQKLASDDVGHDVDWDELVELVLRHETAGHD